MDIYSHSDKAIAEELGGRLRALRLSKNISQQALAEATTLSLNVIKALESGKGKLFTLIAVMRELGALQYLQDCVPEETISPLQLARLQGRQRQRASAERLKGPARKEVEK